GREPGRAPARARHGARWPDPRAQAGRGARLSRFRARKDAGRVDIIPSQGHEFASRWPQRFSPAASISFSISRSVRYSRGRIGRRTVTLTDLGAQRMAATFSMVFPVFEGLLLQYLLEL